MQGKAVRALRATVVVLAVGVVLVLAQQQGAAATALVLAGLAVAAFAWWWWRSPEVAGTVASLAVTCVVSSELTYRVGVRLDLLFTLELGLAFWLFAGVVAVAVWLAPRQRGSRAVTVAVGHGLLLVACVLSVFSTSVVPLAGLIAALSWVTWRSRPRRWPPRRPVPEPVLDAAAARGDERTRQALAGLGAEWRLDGDVLSGPSGMFLVRTRAWSGRVERVRIDGGEAYGWNGDPEELGARLEPVVRDLSRFVRRQGLRTDEVTALVVFWDDTRLPRGGVEMTVHEAGRRRGRGIGVLLVRGERLADRVLRSSRVVTSPGRR